ncbi:MAG: hypothetical protein ABR573_11795 [Candidatus Dormibacteria bacterium]
MKHKLLPLPLGERAPRGSDVNFWQQYTFRTRLESLMILTGLLLGGLGAWLGLHQAPLRVGLDHAGYHLGETTLTPLDPAHFGGDVAIALHQEDGQVRAAAAGRLSGAPMQGLCVMVTGSDTEQCIFVVGDRSFHATDRLRAGSWERLYDDGTRVRIKVADPRHPVPVPVPIGAR